MINTKQTLTINVKLPTLNEYIDACRTNQYKGATFKRDYQNLICYLIRAAGLKRVEGPQWITYIFYEKNKKRDKDNVASFAKKVINDALQVMGILPNDNNEWVAGTSEMFDYSEKTSKITVILEDYQN